MSKLFFTPPTKAHSHCHIPLQTRLYSARSLTYTVSKGFEIRQKYKVSLLFIQNEAEIQERSRETAKDCRASQLICPSRPLYLYEIQTHEIMTYFPTTLLPFNATSCFTDFHSPSQFLPRLSPQRHSFLHSPLQQSA